MCSKWGKLSALALFVAAVWVLSTPLAYGASITTTGHNFIGTGWSNGELCIACHTPHNALLDENGDPEHYLWNHEFSTQTFEIYASRGDTSYHPTDINRDSRRCLGCHDGVTALDAFGGQAGSTVMSPGIKANLGTDLTDDHPISVDYEAAYAADGELAPSADVAAAGLRLGGGFLECTSCHDAHGTPGFPHLLKISNSGSALCFTCHVK